MHVSEMNTRTQVFSPKVGHNLTVAQVSYGKVAVEDVLSGKAKAIEARLSADGRSWWSEWHQGESSGRECYVERYDETGLVFHGWIDQDSRRIVQAG